MKLIILSGLEAFFGGDVTTVFIFTSLAYYNSFAHISLKLTLINSTYRVVELVLVGEIIGALS